MQFEELKLIDPLLRAIRAEGYTTPSPIQEQAIPHVLTGRDLLGCAQTGTGKTAAFVLPILQRLVAAPKANRPAPIRVLILAPTRELATQIGESINTYGRHTGLRQVTIFGGVSQVHQINRLRQGPEILVATPGRLLDLMGQGLLKLDQIEVLVLDEADRMLDMGFIHDVRRVIKAVPAKRQTLLFSATILPDIMELANSILHNPVEVMVTPAATTVESIQQSVYFVEKAQKMALLEHLLHDPAIRRVLVFTRTKHGANKVVQQLGRVNVHAEAIHGNKSQSAREKALANFKTGMTRVLVATDIAARGIDVDSVTHVINYDLPNEPESYVHRIGRTGRAGAAGIAFSFCDTEERAYLRDIERLIRLQITPAANHPFTSGVPALSNPAPRRQDHQPAPRSTAHGTPHNSPRSTPRSDHHGDNQSAQSAPAKPSFYRRRRRPQGQSRNNGAKPS